MKRFVMPILFSLLFLLSARAEDVPKLIVKKDARVAIVGDSITEQKLYSKYIELYLTACTPELNTHVIQLGWSGERAPGFQSRMTNDLMPFKPDVVTTCYGMNDGGYAPFNENTGKAYRTSMSDIVTRLKAAGATVVVGAPGAVDTKFFKGGGEQSKMYNATLGSLRDIAKELATANGMPFANVHDAMIQGMEKSKAALSADYDVCGKDGFHPSPNGQFLMAYAFLKAMGFSGEIGTISVDMKGAATGSEGHKVLSSADGKVEVESARYPFCFTGEEKVSPKAALGTLSSGTRSIQPFVPFNAELNRFILKVTNLESPKAAVTWGSQTKTFTKQELEQGINLAEQFMDNNPFGDAFRKLDSVIANKQNFETSMIKNYVNGLGNMVRALDNDKDAEAASLVLRTKLFEKQAKMHKDMRATFVPVKHTLSIAKAE